MIEIIDPEFDAYLAKLGPYENPPDGCPNCGRSRVMVGDDGLHRCEKCCWCIEEGMFDRDMLSR